jgi:replicative DNA helicase
LDSRKILNGGAGAGELSVVIAPTGVGKSHFLVHIGAQALLQGKSVLHFTFELNERAVGIRYDSHLLDIDSLDCPARKQEVKDFYMQNAGKLGKLRVKYFPTGSATVNTLRSFIDKLSLENFRPDIVIVDYAGIMRSTEKYELARMELKKIYEELRSFAGELDVPVWTACQSNKEGADSDIISLANMSEAYSQAHICDFVVGLGRPEKQKATGFGTIFIAKNRAGVDGISYKVRIDTARSRITMLSEEEIKNVTAEQEREHEEGMNIVRRTLRQINTKKVMGQDTSLILG